MKIAKLIEYRYALTALSRSRAFNAQTWTDIRLLLSKVTAAIPSQLFDRIEEINALRIELINNEKANALAEERPVSQHIEGIDELREEEKIIENTEVDFAITPLTIVGFPVSDRFEQRVPIPYQQVGLQIDPWIAFNNLLDEGIIKCVPEPKKSQAKPTKPAKK